MLLFFLFSTLMTKDGQLNHDFKTLIQFLNKYHKIPAKLSPQTVNTYFQENYLRKPKQERWQMDLARFEGDRSKILPMLRKLNMVDPMLPQCDYYDCVFILGATVPNMDERISFFLKTNVKAGTVYILTGKRPLDKGADAMEGMDQKIYSTEAGGARWLVSHRFKNEFAHIKHKFVETGRIYDRKQRKYRRANTYDTFKTWAKKYGKRFTKDARMLIISTQPFVGYQTATAWHALGTTNVEGAGPKSFKEDLSISIYLDNIARWHYTLMGVYGFEK